MCHNRPNGPDLANTAQHWLNLSNTGSGISVQTFTLIFQSTQLNYAKTGQNKPKWAKTDQIGAGRSKTANNGAMGKIHIKTGQNQLEILCFAFSSNCVFTYHSCLYYIQADLIQGFQLPLSWVSSHDQLLFKLYKFSSFLVRPNTIFAIIRSVWPTTFLNSSKHIGHWSLSAWCLWPPP